MTKRWPNWLRKFGILWQFYLFSNSNNDNSNSNSRCGGIPDVDMNDRF